MYMYASVNCFQCTIYYKRLFKGLLIFFCQNWEDTEGRKKLSKVNARVSEKNILSERCSSFIDTSYLEESNSEFVFH